MPSIRDLRGHPVEEVVDSRVVHPGLPEPGQQMVEREAIRQAVEKVSTLRGQRDPREESGPVATGDMYPSGVVQPIFNRLPLPADMETGLRDLESSLDAILERVGLIREQIGSIRLRAEKDAGKLGRLAELLKQMGE